MIKKHPLVSILVPLYNSEDYIINTLESCVNQTYDNIEIVVVDDGSTDRSYELVREYGKDRPQVSIYTQPNSGGCRARNLAFKKSKGDLIVYLDADDIISTDKIEAQVKLLEGKPDTTICTSQWDRFYTSLDDALFPQRTVYKDYDSGIALVEDLLNGGMFGVTCYMTPRKLVEMAGPWNESLLVNQDGEFFIRILLKAESVLYSATGKLFYRSSTGNSVSRKSSKQKGLSLIDGYRIIYNSISGSGLINDRINYGISSCLHSVAYQYMKYPEIVNAARRFSEELTGRHKVDIPGGTLFRLSCKLIGFWNSLTLKSNLNWR